MASPTDDDLRDALSSYSKALKARSAASKASANLVELDKWYRKELRDLMSARRAGDGEGAAWLEVAELGRLMEWKLTRGKWRPRLVTLALSNSASLVRSTTKSASLLPAAEALTKLCTLSGVGPATASAILALFDPSAEPFMSDEAMQGVSGGGKADYTVKAWKAYREQMQVRKKAGGWNGMEELEKAFWSEAVMKRYEGVEKKGAVQVKAPSAPSKGGKRKSVGSVEGGEGAEPRPTGRAERAAKKHKAA